MKLLQTSTFFASNQSYFQKIAPFFIFQVWDKGDVIQDQDKCIDDIFWIVDGSCSISRRIPFIAKTHYGRTSYQAYTPGDPFTPTKTADLDEKITHIQLQTQENIDAGDWFSYLPMPIKKIQHNEFEKELLFKNRIISPCEYIITADSSKVSTVKLSFEDVIDFASKDVIKSLDADCSIHRFDLKLLQSQFLDQKAYQSFKRNILNEIGRK